MKDRIDPLYWKDSKYPRHLYELWCEKRIGNDWRRAFRKDRDCDSFRCQFLIPIPVRILDPMNAWPELREQGEYGLHIAIKKLAEKVVNMGGPEFVARELKKKWKDRHLGWSYYYPVVDLILERGELYKITAKSFMKVFEESKGHLFFYERNGKKAKKAIRPENISKLFNGWTSEIFQEFPNIVLSEILKNWNKWIEDGKSVDAWTVNFPRAISYCAGLFPLSEEQANKPIRLPW